MKRITWMSFCLLFALFSCSKCEKRDIIARKPVKGMVFNNCTDSGLANIKVYLQTFKGNSLVNSQEAVTGQEGNFAFDADIHSSDKYSYAIHIPSKSGGVSGGFTEAGINGTTMYFSNGESDIFMRPKVTPKFLVINLFQIKNNLSVHTDSIRTMFYQLKYHANSNDMPYSFGIGSYGNEPLLAGNVGNYPMGLYFILTDKWINGSHSEDKDSIYLNWGAQKTYTVFW
jgi:hypothetical protein